MNRRNNDNPGCLTGILQLFLLSKIYSWGQKKFGSERGGCCGCLIGIVFFLIFIALAFGIISNTNWGRL